MTRGGRVPVICREDGCELKLIFARRYGSMRNLPYDAADLAPFSLEATGCHVLIDGTSFTPREAIEHFQIRGDGISEEKARELVAGYPWHRAHFHTDRGDRA